ILCGNMVATDPHDETSPAWALAAHPGLTEALSTFAKRPDSLVLAVMGEAGRDPDLVQALEHCGVQAHDEVDLVCETGAGTRTVLVRTGSLRPDANPPIDFTSSEDRPWLVGMERLDDPR